MVRPADTYVLATTVSIDWGNNLLPVQCQAISWTKADYIDWNSSAKIIVKLIFIKENVPQNVRIFFPETTLGNVSKMSAI